MYSQLLKEILLEMTYDEEVLAVLVNFCRKPFKSDHLELRRRKKKILLVLLFLTLVFAFFLFIIINII